MAALPVRYYPALDILSSVTKILEEEGYLVG
jgi:hypothetical protein